MKISLTTKIIHTLDFDFNLNIYGVLGLSQAMQKIYSTVENIQLLEHFQGIYSLGLTNISPEVLDNFSYKNIEAIKNNNGLYLADLRTVLQDLINREYLPAGDYKIKF